MNAVTAFDHLERDLREKPLFPVEPRDRDPASELDRQQGFRKVLRETAPGVMSWAIPNAGKRGFKAQRQVRREGIAAGAFDEHYAADGWFAALEWKDGGGELSQQQIDWGNAMHRRGFRVACVRTPGFAEALFRQWGAPFLGRVGL